MLPILHDTEVYSTVLGSFVHVVMSVFTWEIKLNCIEFSNMSMVGSDS